MLFSPLTSRCPEDPDHRRIRARASTINASARSEGGDKRVRRAHNPHQSLPDPPPRHHRTGKCQGRRRWSASRGGSSSQSRRDMSRGLEHEGTVVDLVLVERGSLSQPTPSGADGVPIEKGDVRVPSLDRSGVEVHGGPTSEVRAEGFAYRGSAQASSCAARARQANADVGGGLRRMPSPPQAALSPGPRRASALEGAANRLRGEARNERPATNATPRRTGSALSESDP